MGHDPPGGDAAPGWYYSAGRAPQGPVPREEIVSMCRGGQLLRSSLVWNAGMANWVPVSQSEFAEFAVADADLVGLSRTPEQLRRLTMIAMVAWAGSAVASLAFAASSFWQPAGGGALVVLLAAGLVSIVALVPQMILLHQLWSAVRPLVARPTPGTAVGYLFIPAFNLYWTFVAYGELPAAVNMLARKVGAHRSAPASVARAGCIANALSCVPLLNVLTAPVSGALLAYTMWKSSEVVQEVLELASDARAIRAARAATP